jgi:rhamnogalacturonyl hydrolase YesR
MVELKRNILKGVISRNYLILKLIFDDLLKSNKKIYSNQFHLEKAIDWIVHAQNKTNDGGISSSFSLILGWGASYPETSGYLIPTLFDYYYISQKKHYLQICKNIANWECSIQLDNGGFQGDVFSKSKNTTIFNTGQVILGLIRAYKELKIKKYLDCAIKAGNFLVNHQEEDGNWKKFCFNNISHTYNVRVAWALLELSKETNNDEYKDSALKNLSWALTQKQKNYWFQNNAFRRNQSPLLHNICYTIRGFLEAGILLDRNDFITVAKETAYKLLNIYQKNSFLPARFNTNWQSNDFYSCVAGDAQISIIWLKLYQIFRNRELFKNAIKINNYLKSNRDSIT